MGWRLHFQTRSLFDTEVLAAELAKLTEEEESVEIEQGGRFVAALLEAELPGRGFPIRITIREDWGWHVGLEEKLCWMSIGCGYSGEGDYGLHCFVRPEKPRPWHVFKRAKVAQRIAELKQAVEDILRDSGQVEGLQWREDPW
ncbi:MAG: hypothetical protein GC201_06315 [Alphaproteobacteria bacterium]|nr:hypothetical protein [Alphaproteobacteria bacterium]